MNLIRLLQSVGTAFGAPPGSNGDQAVNGASQRPIIAGSSDPINGVRAKLSDDICDSMEDEELEFCIASLSAIWDVLNKHMTPQSPGEVGAGQDLNGRNHEFMEKLDDVLESGHPDPDLGLKQLASHMAMSGRQLQRKLKSIAELQPAEYLRAYRLRKARELLKTGQQVGLVADAVGFSSPAYFTKCFKARFGLTPSEFQQQAR